MANTLSAQKALRQTKRRQVRNLAKKNAYKNAVKSVRKLVTEKKLKEAQDFLSTAFKRLDKAAKTNVIHKNKASRLKRNLAHLINKATK